jgi:hypothetical protein
MAKGVPPTFRAFAELNLRSLMTLQHELYDLEMRLSINNRIQQSLSNSINSRTAGQPHPNADAYARLLVEDKNLQEEIRRKLNEYSKSR